MDTVPRIEVRRVFYINWIDQMSHWTKAQHSSTKQKNWSVFKDIEPKRKNNNYVCRMHSTQVLTMWAV